MEISYLANEANDCSSRETEEREECAAELAQELASDAWEFDTVINYPSRPPCECGKEGFWQGPRHGLRIFACAPCYKLQVQD